MSIVARAGLSECARKQRLVRIQPVYENARKIFQFLTKVNYFSKYIFLTRTLLDPPPASPNSAIKRSNQKFGP